MRELPWEARYVVWSHEHGAWWRGDPGYTCELDKAGRFSRVEALNQASGRPASCSPRFPCARTTSSLCSPKRNPAQAG
jgi:hypothetical protein